MPTVSVPVDLNDVSVGELEGTVTPITAPSSMLIIVGIDLGAALAITAAIGLTIVPIGGGDGIEKTVKSIGHSLYLRRTYLRRRKRFIAHRRGDCPNGIGRSHR